MKGKYTKWESELWSYLSRGDGINCPLYDSCQLTEKYIECFNYRKKEKFEKIFKFLGSEEIDLTGYEIDDFKFPKCLKSSRIFRLVTKLAQKYRDSKWTNTLPVPDDLILKASDNLPIEVSYIPLKAHHGAVWPLKNGWLVQLNSNDTSARQRFTLYHEIFHILVHCEATPIFRKMGETRGFFNEVLAEHFAAQILLPQDAVMTKWKEFKDINRLAAIFGTPKPVIYFGLKLMRLI